MLGLTTMAKKPETQKLSLLPMEVRRGDVLADEEGEWEVISAPRVGTGGRVMWVKVRRRGAAADVREKSWPAHERVAVRRRVATE